MIRCQPGGQPLRLIPGADTNNHHGLTAGYEQRYYRVHLLHLLAMYGEPTIQKVSFDQAVEALRLTGRDMDAA